MSSNLPTQPAADPFPEDDLEYFVDGRWIPVADLTPEQSAAWLNEMLCIPPETAPRRRLFPPDPDLDGYHWVRRYRSAPAIPLYWHADWHRNAGKGWGAYSQPEREHEWEYLGKCSSPDE